MPKATDNINEGVKVNLRWGSVTGWIQFKLFNNTCCMPTSLLNTSALLGSLFIFWGSPCYYAHFASDETQALRFKWLVLGHSASKWSVWLPDLVRPPYLESTSYYPSHWNFFQRIWTWDCIKILNSQEKVIWLDSPIHVFPQSNQLLPVRGSAVHWETPLTLWMRFSKKRWEGGVGRLPHQQDSLALK